MQNDDQDRTGWVQVPTTTAFEAGFQNRIIRAVRQDGELWISIADACAALELPGLPEALDRLDPQLKGSAVLRTADTECRLDMVEAWALAASQQKPIRPRAMLSSAGSPSF